MRIHSAVRLIILSALLVATSFGRVEGQVARIDQEQQARWAERLRSPDAAERKQAFYESLGIPHDEVLPILSRALTRLLEDLNVVVAEAISMGETLYPREDPDFVAAVSRRVAEIRDPNAVGALARAMHGGWLASEALASFGPAAIPPVVAVVEDRDNHHNLVIHGLRSLGQIVAAQEGALPAAARASVLRAVTMRLNGQQYFTTLWAAMDLAVLLGDPELLDTVRELANDSNAVRARGIHDPEIIALTRERAAQRLRGGSTPPR